MPAYPKKLVSPDGGVAIVNDAADEATLTAMGFQPAGEEIEAEEAPKRKGRSRKE